MEAVKLRFDMPISLNKLYRRTRWTVVLSNDAMAWKKYAQAWAYRQYPYNEPLKGLIAVTYRFYGSRLDIDNGIKLISDSCNGIIWGDDRQIIEMHVYVDRQNKQKRVEMEVLLLGEDVIK